MWVVTRARLKLNSMWDGNIFESIALWQFREMEITVGKRENSNWKSMLEGSDSEVQIMWWYKTQETIMKGSR